MKKLFPIFFGFVVMGCSNSNLPTPKVPQKVMDVEYYQLEKLLIDNPGVLLDVRTKQETNNGYLENASFIDFYDENFEEKASWIKKDQPIYIYCHAGGRSSKAADILLSLGFSEVYNLVGGYSNWIDQNLPFKNAENPLVSNLKSYSADSIAGILKSESNVMLVFKTPWCLPCKQLEPVLDSFSLITKNWKLLKINMDNNIEVAKKFEVKSVPTILNFKNNDLQFKHTGYLSLDLLMSKVK
jgi:rhodanese-related sulfurtransferase